MGREDVVIGHRFLPSDTELLIQYLKPKLEDPNFSSHYIEEKVMYGHVNANPWEILNVSSTKWRILNKFEQSVYVFTSLIKKATGVNKKNKSARRREHYVKKAGCGTWHGETGRVKIMDDKGENIIGSKRLLVFQINDASDLDLNMVPYYKMYEYCLCGYDDYVLCHITMNKSKKPKIVSLCGKNDDDDDDGVRSCKSRSSSKTGIVKEDDDDDDDTAKSVVVVQGVEEEKFQELVTNKDQELSCEKDKYVDDEYWSELMMDELLENVNQEDDHDNYAQQPCSQAFEQSKSIEAEKSLDLSSDSVDDLWLKDLFTADDLIGLEALFEYHNNIQKQEEEVSMQNTMILNQVLGKRKPGDEDCADPNKKLCI